MPLTAFVCSGGGAKGSFEAGVLQQLSIKGITPDILFGTSTGALNSAGYAFQGIDSLIALWRGIKSIKDIMNERSIFLLPIYLLLLKGKGVYSMKPLQNKISKMIVGDPKVRAAVCTVNLKDSKKYYTTAYPGMTSTELAAFQQAVLASASTPIMNDVVGAEVDGGIRQITPLQPALDIKATDIYLILGEPFSQDVNLPGEIGNVIDVFNRTIACMVQEMFWQDIQTFHQRCEKGVKLTVYAPDVSLINADDFDPIKIEASIQQGLKAKPVYTVNV